jgi:uncharacterized protein YjbJ (UPF0337 family)
MRNSTINQTKGKMREMKGRVKEEFGDATNNPEMEGRGKGERIAGKVQRKAGEIQRVLED